MKSPTARTMAVLRRHGFTCAVVERFNSFINARMDLFQCMDIVAMREGYNGVLSIQATTKHNVLERVKKSQNNRALKVWLLAKNSFLVVGWEKSTASGREKWTYYVKQAVLGEDGLITFQDFDEFFLSFPKVTNRSSHAEESAENEEAEEGSDG